MIFRRFYDENLAQASYMLACEKTREAIVIDPNSDVAQYTRAAGADRVRIAHVTETHIHADFVSGAAALAEAAGAALHLSGEARGEWGYDETLLSRANALRDSATIDVGRLRLRARHTPGHTPEHLTFLVSDLARGEDPVGALTGDFVFVSDVGRPDLLERAAGVQGSMEASANDLFKSIRAFKQESDYLQIWPGHGAGSACGKSLGMMPQTTLGYEKLFNWAFREMTEEQFVEKVLQDQPIPPRYFAVMKRINRTNAERPKAVEPRFMGRDDLDVALAEHAIVIDTRTAEKFAAGHVPGTINIPLGKSFLNWSGAIVPEDRDFCVITEAESDDAVKHILSDLCKIGLNRVRGIFLADVLREWKSQHGELEKVPQLDAPDLQSLAQRDAVKVVDVRSPEEWRRGHLPGAIHIPLAQLPDRLSELDDSTRVVLHCQGGGRSSIATSLLQSRGFANVANLAGGYEGWVARGYKVESAERTPSASGGQTN
jgi:hydroxyacylglutathione hydrolase